MHAVTTRIDVARDLVTIHYLSDGLETFKVVRITVIAIKIASLNQCLLLTKLCTYKWPRCSMCLSSVHPTG